MAEVLKWDDVKAGVVKWDDVKGGVSDPNAKVGSAANPGEARGSKGFMENLISDPVRNIKKNSIPARLVKWMSTSDEEYASRSKKEKEQFIGSTPMLSMIRDRLDTIELGAFQKEMTAAEEDEHGRLIEAYGNLYGKLETSYDKGDLETGFSMDAVTEAFAEDPGGMLAEIANAVLADPEMLVTPIGWTKMAAQAGAIAKAAGATSKVTKLAEVGGGIAGASSIGAAFSAADSVAEQLKEKGEVNPEQVTTAATIGAIIAPILVGAAKGAIVAGKKGVSLYKGKTGIKRLNKYITKIERQAQEYMAQGLRSPTRAVTRAMDDMFIPPSIRKELAKAHPGVRKINMTKKAIEANHQAILKNSNKLSAKLGRGYEAFKTFAANTFGDLSVELGIISPTLSHAVNKMTMETSVRIKDGLLVSARMSKVYSGLNKADKELLHIALGNSNTKNIAIILARSSSPDTGAMKSISKYLETKFKEQETLGMRVGKITNYFPMSVKDYKVFARSMGYSPEYVNTIMARAINSKFKLHGAEKVSKHIPLNKAKEYLSEEEIATALNKALSTPKVSVGKTTSPHVKERVIQKYTKENIKYYNNPMHTFSDYVTTTENKITEAAFFGGKMDPNIAHSANVDNSIGRLTADLLAKGEILDSDVARLDYLLKARFSMGTKAPRAWIAGFRNILYSAILGNPLSALTQLGDLGNAAYVTSVKEATLAAAKTISRNINVKMEDLGLNNIVQEFEKLGTTAHILDFSLKWSGFRAMDVLGKETTLNAVLSKYQKLASKGKGYKQILEKYKDAFSPKDMEATLQALRKGDSKNRGVKYILWNELARVQPISLTQMPPSFLNNPNARILYMLKSFTLRQLNLVRREAFAKMGSGDVVGGAKKLATWSMILGSTNASVEQTKAWIRGDEVEFNDLVIAQMYRNYGISQYFLGQMQRGQVATALTSLVLPPISAIDSAFGDLANFGERFESLKYVPPFGKGLYYLLKEEEY